MTTSVFSPTATQTREKIAKGENNPTHFAKNNPLLVRSFSPAAKNGKELKNEGVASRLRPPAGCTLGVIPPEAVRQRNISPPTSRFKLNAPNTIRHECCSQCILECNIFWYRTDFPRTAKEDGSYTPPVLKLPTGGASGENVSRPTTGLQKVQLPNLSIRVARLAGYLRTSSTRHTKAADI